MLELETDVRFTLEINTKVSEEKNYNYTVVKKISQLSRSSYKLYRRIFRIFGSQMRNSFTDHVNFRLIFILFCSLLNSRNKNEAYKRIQLIYMQTLAIIAPDLWPSVSDLK